MKNRTLVIKMDVLALVMAQTFLVFNIVYLITHF